jgi:hypothetical protein
MFVELVDIVGIRGNGDGGKLFPKIGIGNVDGEKFGEQDEEQKNNLRIFILCPFDIPSYISQL